MWAALGIGIVTPVRGLILKAIATATLFRKNYFKNGNGPSTLHRNPKPCATPVSLLINSSCAKTFFSIVNWSVPNGTKSLEIGT